MSEYLIQGDTLTGIADAIRAKTGSTGTMMASEMAALIDSISSGIDGYEVTFGTYIVPSRTTNTQVIDTGLSAEPDYFFLWNDVFARGSTDYCFAYYIKGTGYCCWHYSGDLIRSGKTTSSGPIVTSKHSTGGYGREGYWGASTYYWVAMLAKG